MTWECLEAEIAVQFASLGGGVEIGTRLDEWPASHLSVSRGTSQPCSWVPPRPRSERERADPAVARERRSKRRHGEARTRWEAILSDPRRHADELRKRREWRSSTGATARDWKRLLADPERHARELQKRRDRRRLRARSDGE